MSQQLHATNVPDALATIDRKANVEDVNRSLLEVCGVCGVRCVRCVVCVWCVVCVSRVVCRVCGVMCDV